MTITEMHTAFRLGLDKTQSLNYPDFLPEEIDYWLDEASRNFVKTRYSGMNSKRESFEETQKRTDDLRTLIKEVAISPTSTSPTNPFGASSSLKPNSYIFLLPSATYTNVATQELIRPYWTTLGEEVQITYGTPPVNARMGITDITVDTYQRALIDPMSEYILHYNEARPLRLFRGNYVELISDGQYTVTMYYLRYLAKPIKVNSLTTSSITSGNIINDIVYTVAGTGTLTYNGVAYAVGQKFIGIQGVTTFTTTGSNTATMNSMNSDLPEHTHDEIVRIAVNMVLENIEQARYQTHTVELNKQE